MQPLEKYHSVVFDCDGVILNSNSLKTESFRSALAGEALSLIDTFIAYHQSHGGISRYVKLDHFYRVMKGMPDHAEETAMALQRYAAICCKGLAECELIPGVIEVLRLLKTLRVNCYVISGGDQDEVRGAFAEKDLNQYFSGIYGSPRSKMEHLGGLVGNGLSMPAIYFGDAESDCKAAQKYELDFVFIAGQSEWRGGVAACNAANYPIYEDFSELLRCVSPEREANGFTV